MTQTCCGRGGCRNDPYPSGIVVRMLDNRQSLFRSVRDPSTKLLRTLGAPLHDRANCLVVAACLLFTFCCWFESYSTVLLESPASWQSNTLTWSSPNVPGLHLQQVLGVYQKGLALLKKERARKLTALAPKAPVCKCRRNLWRKILKRVSAASRSRIGSGGAAGLDAENAAPPLLKKSAV